VLKIVSKDGLVLLVGLLVGLAAGLVFVYISHGELPAVVDNLIDPDYVRVGAAAPDFTLSSLSGDEVRLGNFIGKPVLINFWATWCGPCRFEMPLIEKFHQRYGDELIILAVNMQEDERKVQIFKNELDLDFLILLDVDSVASDRYRVQGLPTSFIVDPEGKVSAIHIGVMSENQLIGYLEKAGMPND
jgi:thiol-disulfide isomerase/thioredoxin